MPVKSSKTASTTTPRKRRTRKTSTTRTAKAVAKTDKVIKEVQAVLDAPKVKVTKVKPVSKIRTLKTVKRPSTARLITPTRYWSDIKTRWEIHNYEITMLVSDFSKVVTYVTPYHTQLVKQVKAWTVWKLTFFVTTALHTPFFCAWSFRLSTWIKQLWTSFFPLYFKRDTL